MEKDDMKEVVREAIKDYIGEVDRSIGRWVRRSIAVLVGLMILYASYKMGIIEKVF
jgi:hypothetical protein